MARSTRRFVKPPSDVMPRTESRRIRATLEGVTTESGERECVLIALASSAQARMVSGVLKGDCFDVEVVDSGRDMIEAVRGADAVYKAMLLDFTLPDMNGIQALAYLHKLGATNVPPVVIAADAVDKQVVAVGRKLGATDFMLKPFTTEVILTKLRAASGRPGVQA